MKHAILLSLSLVTLGIAVPAAAEDGTFECTTTAGLGNPVLSASFDASEEAGVALGGCVLVSSLSEASTVTSVTPADGCSVSVDIDGDGLTDEPATVGQSYDAESSIHAFCDAGTLDATSSVTLTPT